MSRKLAKRTKRRTAHKRTMWRDKLMEQIAENGMLRARLQGIAEIIEDVDHRAMAADGPVTPTKDEITADELRQIYNIANGGKQVTVRNPERAT